MIKYLTEWNLKNPRIIPFKTNSMDVPSFKLVADNNDSPKKSITCYYFSKLFHEHMRYAIDKIDKDVARIDYNEQDDFAEEICSYLEKSFEKYLIANIDKWKSGVESLLSRDYNFKWIKNYNARTIPVTEEDINNGHLVFCLSKHQMNAQNEKFKKYLSAKIVIALEINKLQQTPNVYHYTVDLASIDILKMTTKEKNILARGESIIYLIDATNGTTVASYTVV